MSRFDRYAGEDQQRTRRSGGGDSRFDRYAAEGMSAAGYPVNGADTPFGAFLSGVGDAASFGWGDEAQGLLFGPNAEAAARMRQEIARASQPGWFLGGQVGGSLVGGGGVGAVARAGLGATRLASLARGVGPFGRIAAGSLGGAAGGALYGAGDAPDGARFEGAVNYAIPGAVLGGAFTGLGELASPILRNVRMSMSPEFRSGRMMAESLERFGPENVTPAALEADVLQRLSGAPSNATVGDVVPGMTQLIRGAGVRPSRMRDQLRDLYDTRNNAMGGQAVDDLWSTLGGGVRRDVGDVFGELREVQRTQAAPLYAEAYRQRLNPAQATGMTAEIMRRNPAIFEPARQHARALMLSEFGEEITDPSDPRYWHALLQGAERELGARLRAASMGDARGFHGAEVAAYTRAVQAFNTQVRRLLGPKFMQAQDVYSGAARAQDALERGYDAAAPSLNSMKVADLMAWMRRARPGELQHMRIGALNRLSDEIARTDTGSGRADVLRALLRNEGQRTVLTRIFGGERGFHDLIRRLDTQRELFRASVDAGIGVNSHTAPLLAAYESQRALANPRGIREWAANMLLRESGDRFDEAVSNQILEAAAINANQAAREAAQVGGLSNWMGGRGLISAALRERRRMLEHRPSALVNAFSAGLYAPVGGGALHDYGMGY